MTNKLHASALGALILIALAAALLCRPSGAGSRAPGDVWRSAMDTRAARKARNVPCPVCGRKLKSKSVVDTHRKAMGY